jgi:GNAT superfamily N-acetyltransferase
LARVRASPAELARLRTLRGAATALWAGESVRLEPGYWSALTGARGVDYNVVVCHAASEGESLPRALEEIRAVGAPGQIMVAGAALGDVQQLVRASWVCVGSMPFLTLDLRGLADHPADPAVRRLRREEMGEARALLDEAFGIGSELAVTALPDDAADGPGRSTWGIRAHDGTLASCWATMRVEDVVSGWSLATSPRHQRRGLAAQLLSTALRASRHEGACRYVGSATGRAEPIFRAVGCVELERWQIWSRPRWVIGSV